MLKENGWISAEQIAPPDYIKSSGYVDFGSVVWWKIPVLKTAASQFLDSCKKEDRDAYEAFKNDNASWLDNYAIFMSIKEFYDAKAKEEDKIEYTDYVGILMSSVTTIVDVIGYVFIAFVSISLIVSSIMIGIITYISVLERTKEIGVLRSIGARKKDIATY